MKEYRIKCPKCSKTTILSEHKCINCGLLIDSKYFSELLKFENHKDSIKEENNFFCHFQSEDNFHHDYLEALFSKDWEKSQKQAVFSNKSTNYISYEHKYRKIMVTSEDIVTPNFTIPLNHIRNIFFHQKSIFCYLRFSFIFFVFLTCLLITVFALFYKILTPFIVYIVIPYKKSITILYFILPFLIAYIYFFIKPKIIIKTTNDRFRLLPFSNLSSGIRFWCLIRTVFQNEKDYTDKKDFILFEDEDIIVSTDKIIFFQYNTFNGKKYIIPVKEIKYINLQKNRFLSYLFQAYDKNITIHTSYGKVFLGLNHYSGQMFCLSVNRAIEYNNNPKLLKEPYQNNIMTGSLDIIEKWMNALINDKYSKIIEKLSEIPLYTVKLSPDNKNKEILYAEKNNIRTHIDFIDKLVCKVSMLIFSDSENNYDENNIFLKNDTVNKKIFLLREWANSFLETKNINLLYLLREKNYSVLIVDYREFVIELSINKANIKFFIFKEKVKMIVITISSVTPKNGNNLEQKSNKQYHQRAVQHQMIKQQQATPTNSESRETDSSK